ncbi:hypothetical protein [Streptomyces cavernae]|uniref:hypothetical protein n=1 Tax=Streptomyces cavernae TaxID=2259034 RepID=UPI000FEBDC67|nr:hypothetical protein [Streptomyces cavernae]
MDEALSVDESLSVDEALSADESLQAEADEADSADRRPSRLADVALALLLAVADALALAGVALVMFLIGMSRSEPPGSSPLREGDASAFLLQALVWLVPLALGVSAFVHARLRMPVTAVVQGLFFVAGTVLAVGQARMLLSLG